MKRRLTAVLTVLTMLMGLIGVQPYSVEADAVKAGSTIEISTLAELEAFRDSVNGGNTYEEMTVKLTADIDMSEKYGADINGKEVPWTPIGISYEESFRGTFDGNRHEVKGLYINTSEDYQGLFGFTYGAEIKNISVSGSVHGGWMVGGIAGYNQEGLMENCHNKAAVTGGWKLEEAYYIGGVTGRNDGTLKNCSNEGDISIGSKSSMGTGGVAGVNNTAVLDCSNTGSVSGVQNVGGIIGENGGEVTNSHNTGTIEGEYYLGGIIGFNSSEVMYCSNEGSVTGIGESNIDIGGIAGASEGSIEACYNTGDVSGFHHLGGIVGGNWDLVADCYNKGAVTGSGSNIGGVIGINVSTVLLCYNTGDVTGKGYRVGGISGLNDKEGIVAGCYSIGNISGAGGVGGVIGVSYDGGYIESCYYLEGTAEGGIDGQDIVDALQKSAADFARQSTFYNWDFNAEWEISSDLGRPVLRSNKEEKRIETISTLEELEAFRDSVNSGNTYSGVTVRLTADIDMSGKYGEGLRRWTPIGISYEESFRGIFDGGGHKIKGLYVGSIQEYQGLFGWTYGATIKNITVSGSVRGGNMTGGIVGYNQEGLIENCHNEATVTGDGYINKLYYIGGVTGRNDGTVKKCSNTGDIDTWQMIDRGIGGIAGVNYTDVLDCTNSGKIKRGTNAGGIVGENEGTLENCHNIGVISADYTVGGIVGRNGSTVKDCSNSGDITGLENVGGIGGKNEGVIENCHNTGIVLGEKYSSSLKDNCIGGIAGWNGNDVKYCSNKGSVGSRTKNLVSVGGITGYNSESESCAVESCYNTAEVSGFLNVGGITGNNYALVAACYNTGTITGDGTYDDVVEIWYERGQIGGITGYNHSYLILCYNTGTVRAIDRTTLHKNNIGDVGGICGENSREGIIGGCYNIGNVSGAYRVGGVLGKNADGYDYNGHYVCGYVADCYYLKDTANGGIEGEDTVGAVSKSMADFARQSTFYNWDFNAEWEMSSDLGRPVLRSNKEVVLLGDVDGDREITVMDALAILKFVAEIEQSDFIEEAADCDKDKDITPNDALTILKHVAEIMLIS